MSWELKFKKNCLHESDKYSSDLVTSWQMQEHLSTFMEKEGKSFILFYWENHMHLLYCILCEMCLTNEWMNEWMFSWKCESLTMNDEKIKWINENNPEIQRISCVMSTFTNQKQNFSM
jgi:hypothetical protein